jgi:hypothetical protein
MKKHEYEIVPIINEGHGPFLKVGSVQGAVYEAEKIMTDRPEVERVNVYHSHPSPGPQRRYIGFLDRGSNLLRHPDLTQEKNDDF